MMQDIEKIKKWLRIGTIAVILLLIFIPLYSWLTTTRITIESPGADISVATEKEGEFELLGRDSVTYSFSSDKTVYFQAINGVQVSRLSVNPSSIESDVIVIPTAAGINERLVIESSLKDVLIEDNEVFGLDGREGSIVNAGLDEFIPPRLSYIGLPFMNDLIWKDSNNFIYETFQGFVGRFVNNRDAGLNSIGSNSERFYQIAQFPGKPIVLLGLDNIKKSSDYGKTLSPVTSLEVGDARFLDVDDNYIYYAKWLLPGAYASEGDEDVELGDFGAKTDVEVYTYDGELVTSIEIDGIVGTNDIVGNSTLSTVVVLHSDGLSITDTTSGEYENAPLYFESDNMNIIGSNGGLILFTANSIWRYELSSGVYYRLVEIQGNHTYIVNSAEFISDSVVRYSIGGPSGGVYEIEL